MGKYYSTAANSDAIANSDSRRERSIDIFARAGQSAGRVTLIDVRVSDLERDADEVNRPRTGRRFLRAQLRHYFKRFPARTRPRDAEGVLRGLPRLDSNQE